MLPRIVIVGHSCVDLSPELRGPLDLRPGTLQEIGPLGMRPGGCVVNTAAALVELGLAVRIQTTVGDDLLGRYLHDELLALSPDAKIVVASHAATSYSIVLESEGRSRTLWHHAGSAAAFDGQGFDPTDADVVHLGYPPTLPALLPDDGAPLRAILDRARQAGATTSVDMSVTSEPAGTRDWTRLLTAALPLIDVFSPSVDDLTSIGWLTPEPTPADIVDAADRILAAGAAVVLVSDGERGAWLAAASETRVRAGGRLLQPLASTWHLHREWVAPAPVGRVATTNGAGDTATAGLLFALVSGVGPHHAGRFAAELAAHRIEGHDPLSALANARER